MIWYVALGSAVGGVARFLLSGVLQRSSGSTFPVGTLVVNISGSLLIGFLMRYLVEGAPVSPEVRAMLTTGFCGGYTTFSAVSYETAMLIEQGDLRRSAVYVVLSVSLSLAAALAGMGLARSALSLRGGA